MIVHFDEISYLRLRISGTPSIKDNRTNKDYLSSHICPAPREQSFSVVTEARGEIMKASVPVMPCGLLYHPLKTSKYS